MQPMSPMFGKLSDAQREARSESGSQPEMKKPFDYSRLLEEAPSVSDEIRALMTKRFNDACEYLAKFIGYKLMSGVPVAAIIVEIEQVQTQMQRDDDAAHGGKVGYYVNPMGMAIDHTLRGLRRAIGEPG